MKPVVVALAGGLLAAAVSTADARASVQVGVCESGSGGGDDDFSDAWDDSALDLSESDIDDHGDVDSHVDDLDVESDTSGDSGHDEAEVHEDSEGSNQSGSSDDDTEDTELSDNSGSSEGGSSTSGEDSSGSNSGSSHSESESHSADSHASGSNSGSDDGGRHSGHGSHGGSASETYAAHAESHALTIDRDEMGREFVSGEVLLAGERRDVEAAEHAGFRLISGVELASIGSELARLHTPEGMTVRQAIARLHAIAPGALVTPNDVYRNSQTLAFAASPQPMRAASRRRIGDMGIIDTGVDPSALPAADALIEQHAFAGERSVPRQHGAVVAALAIDHGMRVHVADVFSESDDGRLAASAESIAAALNWMLERRIAVINVSIEGPDNLVLRQLVRRAAARGHVIVAAAGNGGPLAHPAYPAAFDGAVAVTAIDADGRPYLRANRGSYIAFAAHGVDVGVATGSSHVLVSGTSFAAPIVAARIATRLHEPSPAGAQQALAALREQAVDLGEPGRDPIFGWGALHDPSN